MPREPTFDLAGHSEDAKYISKLRGIADTLPKKPLPEDRKPIRKAMDLSHHLHYIRNQKEGCWGYATLAAWDIMNEIACPYSPNLSFRQWRTFHNRPELSAKHKGVFSPDGRFHNLEGGWVCHRKDPPFLQSFGCTTEGTEPTLQGHPYWWQKGGWTREGVNEASNYRFSSQPQAIPLKSAEFIKAILNNKPVYFSFDGHVMCVVGYDQEKQTFKFVNSWGDNWGDSGYGTFTFEQLDKALHLNVSGLTGPIHDAFVFNIHPPRPIPAARISFKHTKRANVHLSLGVQDSPHTANKIWPHGWDDGSRNLCLTVRLPSEFIWPPDSDNRLFLDLHDSGEYSQSGGTLEVFTVAFGGIVVECPELAAGPVVFGSGEFRRFIIP